MFKPFLVFNRINWKCCCIFKSFETIWSITCILYTYMIISNAFLWRTYYIINSAQIDWMLSVSVVTKDSHILIQLFKLFKLQSKKKKKKGNYHYKVGSNSTLCANIIVPFRIWLNQFDEMGGKPASIFKKVSQTHIIIL